MIKREGASYLSSPRVNRVTLEVLIGKLNECCDKYKGERGDCPDQDVCVEGFDARCQPIDVKCSSCGETVPRKRYCEACGERVKT